MVTMPATLSIGENINPPALAPPASPPPDTTQAAAAVTVVKKRRPPRRYNLSLPTFSWGGAQRVIPWVKDPANIPLTQAALPPLPPKEKGKESAAAAAAEIPWKLRKRKAENGPTAAESVPPPPPPPPVAAPKEKVKRISTKLTVPLSAMEIREDFLLMRGKKPASRPKKRPKHVQKLLDELFPGLWLSEITPDLYRIDEEEGPCDSDS